MNTTKIPSIVLLMVALLNVSVSIWSWVQVREAYKSTDRAVQQTKRTIGLCGKLLSAADSMKKAIGHYREVAAIDAAVIDRLRPIKPTPEMAGTDFLIEQRNWHLDSAFVWYRPDSDDGLSGFMKQ